MELINEMQMSTLLQLWVGDAKDGCKCEGVKCNPTPRAVDLILTSYPRAKISGIALH